MGMTDEEIKDVWRVVSAVCLMGNIETAEQRRGGEQAVIKDDSGVLGRRRVDWFLSTFPPSLFKIQSPSV